ARGLGSGWNYRLAALEGALGGSQTNRIDDYGRRRAGLAGRYDRQLANSGLALPRIDPDSACAWHLYVVGWNAEASGISRREAFERLRAGGIGVQVHYIPVHTQPHYRKRGFQPGQYPNAEAHYARAITIPLYPTLTETQQDEVVEQLLRLSAGTARTLA